MRLISNRVLREFSTRHRGAEEALQGWRKRIEACDATTFAALRAMFNAVDRAGDYYVFNVGGNHYRVVAAIHFNRQIVFVRHVFTHAEYDRWRP